MKSITLVFLIIFPALLTAQPELNSRLDALEDRLTALETAISSSGCELKYKFHTYRLNRCDKGTFVRAVTDVGSGTMQLECGYYQLLCSSDKSNTQE